MNIVLRKIYYDVKGYHQSAKKLLLDAKKQGYNFNLKDVEEFLHRQAIWQIHSPPPKYIPQFSYIDITHPNDYHQADILYMPHDVVRKKIFKYCLTIIDIATRYKWAVPLTNRSSNDVAKAFKMVYTHRKCLLTWPYMIHVDGGSEFKGEVRNLMNEKGVKIRIGTNHKQQCLVERFNYTLAKRLFRIQDAYELHTRKKYKVWVKNLLSIINDLNNSVTRLIGMTPIEAMSKNKVIAKPSKLHKNRTIGKDEERLPEDTLVRYLLDKSDFEGGKRRATDPIWSTDIYNFEYIIVRNNQPVMYRLHNGPKKFFIREELLVVPSKTELPPINKKLLYLSYLL